MKRPLILGVAAAAFLTVGCGGTISAATGNPTGVAATAQPTASATPNSLTGPVGTSFTDTDSSGNVMSLTLTTIEDPAHGTQYESPTAGSRFVAAKFKLVGTSGTSSDDANSTASLIGSDGQTYSPDFDNVTGCTNFNSGEYSVGPGQTSIGCVVFQVPTAVHVAQIEWSAEFSTAPPAIWTA